MKPVSSASKSLHVPSIALAGALVLVCAGPAVADKRHPAPIVYANGTSPYPAGQPQYIEPSRTPDAQVKKEARIQFRYPGQSGTNYAATSLNGAGQGSPVTAAEPRQYASIQPPAPSYTPAADSFSARAAAARKLTPAAAYPVSADPVPVFDETGVAIVYGSEFHGLPTANGETFDPNAMTAAHPTLPLPSLIQVVNTETGKEVVLRVNDRGPFEDGASLQVSPRAANELGMNGAGKATLRIRYLGSAPAAVTTPTQPERVPEPQTVAEPTYAPATPEYLQPAAYVRPQTQVQPQPRYDYNSPSPVSAEAYFVQIGSFTDIANAQTLSNQVRASLPVTIVPARINGADFFRVRVGPLPSRDEAERTRQDLAYSGIAQGRIVTGD